MLDIRVKDMLQFGQMEVTLLRPLREYTQYDENGEMVFTHTTTIRKVHANYSIFFVKELRKFINEVPNLMTVRLLLLIASKQAFSKGVAVSTERLCKELQCSRQSIQAAKKWLIEHNYLKMVKREGIVCWWINPLLATRGLKNWYEKVKEWEGLSFEKDIGGGISATILSNESKIPDVVIYDDSDVVDKSDEI